MALRIQNDLRSAIVDMITGTYGTARLRVYGGTQPGTAGDSTTANVLADFTVAENVISWNPATNGTAAISASKTTTAGTTGTASWARLSSTDGTSFVIDGACGTASTCDFVIDAAAISAGAVVTLTAATIIQPAS